MSWKKHLRCLTAALAGLLPLSWTDFGEPIIARVEYGNFVLYVMMESLRINPVDIQVYIDSRRAIDRTAYL